MNHTELKNIALGARAAFSNSYECAEHRAKFEQTFTPDLVLILFEEIEIRSELSKELALNLITKADIRVRELEDSLTVREGQALRWEALATARQESIERLLAQVEQLEWENKGIAEWRD